MDKYRDKVLSVAKKKAAERAYLPQAIRKGFTVEIIDNRVTFVKRESPK